MIDHHNWYQYFFNGLALDLWDQVVTPEYTAAEITFIKNIISLPHKATILDMPCGSGRHSIALASEGYQLTSVDISDQYINLLKEEVAEKELSIEVLKMDMLDYSAELPYDVVLCLGNSFSYFVFDQMILFSKVLSRAVKHGGFLLVNTSSLAESMLPNQNLQNWMQVGDLYFLMSHQYDSLLGALKTDMQFIRGDEIEKKTAYHFTYTLSEILRIFTSEGFKLERVCSDLEGNAFHVGNRQAYILFRKQ